MFSIHKIALPNNALLSEYVRDGYYTDCYTTDVSGTVSHAEYVAAFYTTFLFKTERLILRWIAGRPSTDDQARQLAAGETNNFAAWVVESRSENQILLCDFRGRTRSWLMVSSIPGDGENRSRLYFGSAVVPTRNSETGVTSLGLVFKFLAGFHKAYSVALLRSAKSNVERAANSATPSF